MAWTQQDGYWSRPFDCHDRLFQLLCGIGAEINREYWLINVNAKIDLSALDGPARGDITTNLQAAWKALRFRHPDIALEIHEREKRYYPIRENQQLDRWCNETFHIETKTTSLDEFFSEYRHSKPHATLHWFPATSQVALIASHVRWDGRGALWMLHEFLSVLEAPVLPTVFDGAEAENLVPALGEVIGMPKTLKPEWEEIANEIFQPFLDAQPCIGLPPPGGLKASLRETKRVEVVFPADLSKNLREAARKQGLTVSSAVQTAAIMALRCMNDPKSYPENYVSWASCDLRKYCPEPFNGPTHAPSLRVASLPLIVKS
ncbi:hypothetical protein N7540_002474 [Penicillium herquei]|nr:hypothetical protein N7540_002474 [Penicillium herquei]